MLEQFLTLPVLVRVDSIRCSRSSKIPTFLREASASVPWGSFEAKRRPQTLIEKIVQKHASLDLGKRAAPLPGDYISLSPWEPPRSIPRHSSSTPSITTSSPANLKKYADIEAFAAEQGVSFYPKGRGIGHQRMPGRAPWSDSHSNTYGAVGCLGTPMVRTDAMAIWQSGRTWYQLAPVTRLTLTGKVPVGSRSTERPRLASIPIDSRLTISNMSTEWGALSCLFPIDETLEHWLRQKADEAALYDNRTIKKRINHERIDELFANPPKADRDAVYAKQLYLNFSTLSPYVTGPDSVKVATPLHELAPRILRSTAREPRYEAQDRRRADGIKFHISAASAPEQKAAEAAGDWQVLVDAGAQPMLSGCAKCIGLGRGLLEAGQVGISASNRNFKGRMGSRDSQAYLASPEIVAASALRGTGAEPLAHLVQQMDLPIERIESAAGESDKTQTEMLPGFSDKISGQIIWLDSDNNLSTDGILTYRDDVTKDEVACACMQNYDPDFGAVARPGDILVSGYNFGTGSSREQAATAIIAKQIPLVVAGSFSNTFARNAINNALINLQIPSLVERLRAHFSSQEGKRY
ncbi:hypothetical protein Egran_01494 [Elaphomyces granulatus]|uniref:Homoaconitase, mitochondrial n=1 Tax=Elaphomyces granulatus TaxID=519963 RepID=A0A232M2W7_9EURO|nr:hypothetical protein Egran_01494 [Elaphomyces granulatus]